MSAMPQTPKLTIRTPITTAITALPSQFDEAFRIPRSMGPTCWQEGTGTGPSGNRSEFRKMGVTGLITHHKVAVAAPQPRYLRHLKRLTGRGSCGTRYGRIRGALLAKRRKLSGI